jgi:hypothetical protein
VAVVSQMPKHLAHANSVGARQEHSAELARTVASRAKSCFECGPLFASRNGSILASTEVRRRETAAAVTTTRAGRCRMSVWTARLIATVKRGTASDLAEEWRRYPTLETARAAAKLLIRKERVAHLAITCDDEVPPRFVEWAA